MPFEKSREKIAAIVGIVRCCWFFFSILSTVSFPFQSNSTFKLHFIVLFSYIRIFPSPSCHLLYFHGKLIFSFSFSWCMKLYNQSN